MVKSGIINHLASITGFRSTTPIVIAKRYPPIIPTKTGITLKKPLLKIAVIIVIIKVTKPIIT